jgi:hypothetical protein
MQVMVSLAEVDSDAIWLILTRLSRGVQRAPPNPSPKLLGGWAVIHPAGLPSIAGTSPGTATVAAALLERVRRVAPSWEARLEDNARQKEPLSADLDS